jgi:hypothetical protein
MSQTLNDGFGFATPPAIAPLLEPHQALANPWHQLVRDAQMKLKEFINRYFLHV